MPTPVSGGRHVFLAINMDAGSQDVSRVGIVGCGKISGLYFQAGRLFDAIEVVACADIDMDRARDRAAEFDLPRACTVEQLLADPDIEIVVNLTVPAAHAPVARAALDAGKHVYNEKPMAATRDEGRQLVETARDRNLRLGCAPDTFLGAGLQTCRKLIDDGAIGRPVGATAFIASPGPDRKRPDAAWFFQPGAGPLFDIGPYYLTTMVNLLGPVRRVSGSAKITCPRRISEAEQDRGTVIEVTTPTHVAGVMDFVGGAVGTILASFDVWAHQLPRLEVYGTEGSLSMPDPNTFGGPVRLFPARGEWCDVPLTHGYAEQSRGLGIADMARAIRTGRPHRANGDLAFHVLDIMTALLATSDAARYTDLQSTTDRPAPMPTDLPEGAVDD